MNPQGSKFRIPQSLIQDPAFTAADRAFLINRGHTVLPYPTRLSGRGDGFPLDPSLLPRISDRTFFFAPALDLHVAVDVLLAAKPSLYWGHDMCLDVAYPHFVCRSHLQFPSSGVLPIVTPFLSNYSPSGRPTPLHD